MKKKSIFIVGVHRSGTTAVAKLLGLSDFAVVQSEPTPNLNVESGLIWGGALSNPKAPLIREVLPRIAKAHQRADIYVEKQNSLLPFITDLHELTNCRFVAMKRSGEETVRSLLNWHEKVYPMFYREAGGNVLADGEGGEFDSSLPRPLPGEEYADKWNTLDRLEMLSWYWNRAMLEFQNQISQLPSESVFELDINDLGVETARELYEFSGLPDFKEEKATELLASRVNSIVSRSGESGKKTIQWGPEERSKFARFVGPAMRSFHYWERDSQLPISSGEQANGSGYDEVEKTVRDRFEKWCESVNSTCSFATKKEVSNLSDFDEPTAGQFDLICSLSGLANTPDPEFFLRRACQSSRQLLYLRCESGWNPKFRQHEIFVGGNVKAPVVSLSPSEVGRVVKEEGFENYVIFPQKSFREDIAAETIIVASRNPVPEETLMPFHEPHQTFEPYLAENDEKKSALDVLEEVNQSCHYFSTSEGGYVADSLVDFDELIQSLVTVDSRKPGTVEELICGEAGINLAVRIDVDMDLMAAADMANLASIREMPLSFYLLHTAAYYGVRDGKTFRRFSRNSKIYNFLQDCGHEVGLHTDALTIYRDWGIDGASAILTEIEWLRSEGLRISGTAAHNCAPVYGAENFEIFDNRVIGNRNHTVSDWSCLPLGVLNEEELSLKYEANAATPSDRIGTEAQAEYLSGLPCADFNRNATWMRKYLLENPHNSWGSDFSIWHLGGGFWVISGKNHTGESVFRFGVSQEQVIGFISDLDLSLSVVLVLHPAYFGKRYAWGGDPLFSAARQRNKFLKPLYSLKYRMIRKVENRVNEMAEKERKKMNES